MQTKLNREFLVRHLFVAVLMTGLGCWFGYDGLVRYPATDVKALYVSIEKADPPATMTLEDLEKFKAQKTKTQHGFMVLALLAGAAVAAHLFAVSRFRLSFDDTGFEYGGRRFSYSDISGVDDSAWKKKGVSVVSAGAVRFKADAWHHVGVKEFHGKLVDAGVKGVEA